MRNLFSSQSNNNSMYKDEYPLALQYSATQALTSTASQSATCNTFEQLSSQKQRSSGSSLSFLQDFVDQSYANPSRVTRGR